MHRGVEYHYMEWIAWNGEKISGYGCRHFKFWPYNVNFFSTKTEIQMKDKIDEMIDNHDKYVKKRELQDVGCAEYYASKNSGDYTGD